MFVTSQAFTGALGGVAGADAKCQAAADGSISPRINGRTFLAWISTSGTSPAGRFTRGVKPYVRSDGLLVANDWTDLTDLSLNHGISVDEAGVDHTAEGLAAWTGTSSKNGDYSGQACADWTSFTFIDKGDRGNVGGNGSGWSSNGGDVCGASHNLYCFEK